MHCICALYNKRKQIKFFEKIFDRCARSPASFENHYVAATAATTTTNYWSEDCFSNLSVC